MHPTANAATVNNKYQCVRVLSSSDSVGISFGGSDRYFLNLRSNKTPETTPIHPAAICHVRLSSNVKSTSITNINNAIKTSPIATVGMAMVVDTRKLALCQADSKRASPTFLRRRLKKIRKTRSSTFIMCRWVTVGESNALRASCRAIN